MKRLTGTLTRVRLSDRFLKRWHPTSKVFSRQDTKENGNNHGKASTMEKSFAALNDGLADKKRKYLHTMLENQLKYPMIVGLTELAVMKMKREQQR